MDRFRWEDSVVYASDDAPATMPHGAELCCDSCIQDGDERPAEGYCVDCDNHLCGPCFQFHCKPQPCRDHKLLGKNDMPTSKSRGMPKDKCKDICTVHKDEILKYYCEDHDQFGCTVCITLGHRTCNVGYIPTLAENILDSDEYKSFKLALDGLSQRANRCSDLAIENAKSIQNQADRSTVEIDKLRKEVNDFFDKLKRETEKAIQHHKSEHLTKFEQLTGTSKALGGCVQEVQREMKDKEAKGQKCRLLMDIKGMKNDIAQYEKEMADLENDNKLKHMSFLPSSWLIELARNSSTKFGACVSHNSDITVHSDNGILITDIVLLANKKLVVFKYTDNYLLIINAEQKQVIQAKLFPCNVVGLTRMSDTEFAIWINNKIEIYCTTNEMQLQRTIQCPGLRWPIVYTNNTFIGFTETSRHAIKIIDTDGVVVKMFQAKVKGKETTIGNPQYIAVNQDNTLLYVSDSGTNIVTCLTMAGEVRAEFQPQKIWGPRGIALSREGTLYVCDIMNHNIHVLTSDLLEVGVIHGEIFGITKPRCIAYCDTSQKLYVGMNGSTKMSVLKMK